MATTKGKITMKGATLGAQVGAVLGGITEGILGLAEKSLKKGAELTKKSVHEGRELLSKGLEKTGETLSDEGIAKRKMAKANKTIARAEELKKQYAKPAAATEAPKTQPKTEAETEIVDSIPSGAVTVHNGQ